MPDKEIFERFGPVHLTTVDWTNSDHRRSVAASLVRGVYVLEVDRDKKRRQTLAPPWWEAFHFKVYKHLTDNAHSRICGGAIFQLTEGTASEAAPRCVVAFRGTLTRLFGESFIRDLKLDIRILWNSLRHTSCVQTAINAVRDAVEKFGSSNVWIAGHSLGAAVALLAGKEMARTGVFIDDTFLFNSPFPSLPIDRTIRSRRKRFAIRVAKSVVKAGVALSLSVKEEDRGTFADLEPWRPHLFVNPGDLISEGYIGYFEHRKLMEEVGGGELERVSSQYSLVGLALYALGAERWREPMHLIPSAHVTVNRDRDVEAHGIDQWWRSQSHLHMETKTYTFTKTHDDDANDDNYDDDGDDDDESY